jgi:serine/threonine protein kinase
MDEAVSERNLLAGILALQFDLVRRDELIAAMQAWLLEKQTPLESILLRQEALDTEDQSFLSSVVEQHLRLQERNSGKSFAPPALVESARTQSRSVDDAAPSRTLQFVSTAGEASHKMPASASGTNGDRGNGALDPYATQSPRGETTTTAAQRFRILRPHARGGLGEVFVALDTELNREVALKEIQPQYADNQDGRARFMLEAEITGRLEHPGIVPVYGFGAYADGRPFYAMRFIRSGNLEEAINDFHRRDWRGKSGERTLVFHKLLSRFVAVCNAIQYAHDRGVLHRDIKPMNIMLGNYGETLVVDWGLAKPAGERLVETGSANSVLLPTSGSDSAPTQMGMVIGTPVYMSPEQAAGRHEELSAASDIYSLGATLFELITGRGPWTSAECNGVGDLLRRVQRGDFRRPRTIEPEIAKPLEAICLKAMALAPAERYSSAAALAEDIEHWLADEPISAIPEGALARTARWVRRHKSAAVAGAAALLLVAGVSSVSALIIHGQKEEIAKQKIEVEKLHAIEEEEHRQTLKLAEENANLAKSERAQRHQAEESATKAARLQKEAEQVRDFLVATFDAPGAQADGRSVTAAAALERAVESAREMDGDPIMKALFLEAIGHSYNNLGMHEEAKKLHEEAVELNRRHRPSVDQQSFSAKRGLLQAYKRMGELEKAIPLAKEILDASRATLGADHPDSLKSLHQLAEVHHAADQHEEAARLFDEAHKLRRATLGPDHPDTVQSQEALESANRQRAANQGGAESQTAVARMKETYTADRSKYGVAHHATLISLGRLTEAYRGSADYERVIPLYEETLKALKAARRANPSDLCWALGSLADLYRATNDFAKALPLYEELLERTRTAKGAMHTDTRFAMNDLAGAYRDAVGFYERSGKSDEAKACREKLEGLTARERKEPQPSPKMPQDTEKSASAVRTPGS